MSTTSFAKAERLNVEALAEQVAATAQVAHNVKRLEDVKARMADITDRRISGTSSDRDAAEYAALHGDAALLEKLLTAARQTEKLATEKMRQANAFLIDAQREHDRELATVKYQALLAKCKEIEAVFCRAIGEVGRAGQVIGISTLGQAFQKSDTLHRALDLGVPPPAA
jgi:hypothetical protein